MSLLASRVYSQSVIVSMLVSCRGVSNLTFDNQLQISTMVVFNGTARIRVLEARNLRPTEWSKRFNAAAIGDAQPKNALIDCYVNVDYDEYHIGRTSTKPRTCTPVWSEDYQCDVHNGKVLGFSVFHDCALPPDDFVANCRIPFDDLKLSTLNDIWVCEYNLIRKRRRFL